MDKFGRFTRLSGRYEVRQPLGSGAMGEVYRAWDREAGREVALKWLPRRDPDELFRLKHEFRSLAGIVHPNLLRLYELVVEGAHCFITAELIEGGRDLVSWLAEVAPGAREAAIRSAFRQLARGISTLHARGKVHRDIKPANVLVDPAGRLVVLDFGLVRELDAEAREEGPGALVGSFACMSPEQARGAPLTPASDWYSVGVLLYECLARVSPFAGATALELADRRWLSIPPLSTRRRDIPADLARLATALLAFDPAERPGAAEILAVLDPDGDAARAMAPAPSPFVGREEELRLLAFAYATVRTGEAYVVTISGPSGIGKTALVERFLDMLPAGESLFLRARCHPHEAVPFAALDEAVDGLTRHLLGRSAERNATLVPRDIDALLTVFPVLGRVGLPAPPAPRDTEPHLLRRRGFRALRELLAALATERPIVVWIDDLQWADPDSAPLLRELLRPPSLSSVLWLVAHREDEREDPALRRLLDELPALVGEASRDLITLRPLAAEESRALLGVLAADTGLEDEQIAALAGEGAGFPFLLGELARSVQGGGGPGARGGYADVLQGRLAGLAVPARQLVETLAVAGRPLDRRTALEAAGLDTFDPDLVAGLERDHFLRTSGGREGSLEIYHARIQEALVADLALEQRRERHAALADALERCGSDDPRALFEHHRGAGRAERAARYAFRAAEQAAAQLAFDHAAQLFGAALELGPEVVDRGRALRGRADALANAGRGREAALAFAAAAAHARTEGAAEDAVRLRCSAAEQHLISGHLDEGVAVLQPLFAELGLRYPPTTRAAFAATFASLPALALRSLRPPRTVARGSSGGDALLAIDAYHTAAKGLVVVDPARGAYFAVRSLIASLGAADPVRRGRAYCVVGAAIVPLGGPLGAWGRRMLAEAHRLAILTGDPYLEGMVSISQAQMSCVDGRWGEMLRRCDEGIRRLRAHCRGVRWECDVGNMAALRALEELGRIGELEQRLPALLEEARAFDDLYAEVTFRLNAAIRAIPRGEIERARREVTHTMESWSGEGFQMQHLYELRIQAFCDLYEGDAEAAWRRVEAAWPALRRSNLLAHQLLRGDALAMRAQVALAFAGRGAGRRDAARVARKASRALARIGRPDAVAAATLLRAGMAWLHGDRPEARALAAHAAALFEAAGMPLHAAQARLCALAGAKDPAERPAREAARADLLARRVADPERWLRVAAPPFETAARA